MSVCPNERDKLPPEKARAEIELGIRMRHRASRVGWTAKIFELEKVGGGVG